MNRLVKALGRVLLMGAIATSSANVFAQSSTPATNAEVLQELEHMRARIQELETQLKAKATV